MISTYNRVTIIYIYILLPFRAHFFFFFFFLIRDESQNAGDRSIDLKRKLKIGLIHCYNCHAFPRIYIYIYIPNIARPENVKRLFCTTDKETIFVFSRVNLVHVCIHSSESVFETRKTLSVEKSEGRIGLRYTSICYAWQSRRLEHRIDTCSLMQLKLAT